MAVYRGKITQGGADTFTIDTIATGITVDSKFGIQINEVSAFWENGYSLNAIDCSVNMIVATQATVTTPDMDEELARVNFAVANTAGVAVAYPIVLLKVEAPIEPRVTVQPNIYMQAASSGSGQANVLYYFVQYEIVKLSDNELMRLLIGGA